MATTYVHYMYHAPESTEGVKIAVDSWPDKTPQDVLPLIGSPGGLTKVRPDDRDKNGDTREFKVLSITIGPFAQREEDMRTMRASSNRLVVHIAEPDA